MSKRNYSIQAKLNLIIGGGGFIGSHLVVALLAKGSRVRVLDWNSQEKSRLRNISNSNLEWIEGDFSSEEVVQKALNKVDVVFHLVSTTQPSASNKAPIFDIQSNLVATVGLLEQMRYLPKVPIIFISSGGTVYGDPQQVPIDESHPTEPQCSYGIVKLAIEKYFALYHLLYGINHRVLRMANPYGPGQELNPAQGVIGAFLSKIMHSQTLEIWGDGSVVRDYIYIGDAIEGMQKAASYQGQERIFNIGSGIGVSISEIILAIEGVTGRQADIKHSPRRPFDVPINVLDIQRAHNELGWAPATSLEEGLATTCEWLSKRPFG